ncbi:MAG TPA: helix-turn-helix transcriptional regulator [Puia sp.]|jgi:transcriptional regulator with XRE-family HTH domain|nr:helix-turn-helix transcriptional regulator [Puia sp.]
MTNADMPKVHEGRNVKRFREMLGVKQEALAAGLGDDWSQKKISLLEQKESIEPEILDQVAKILKVNPEAIRSFSEEAANHFFNTFYDHSGFNYQCTFNPLDKVMELYERLLASEKEKVQILEKKINEGKK